MTYSVKEAVFADIPDIARIHVLSWQQTYAGLIPQDYLNGMSVPDRQEKWEELFRGDAVEDNNLLVAYEQGEAAGFISFGRGRDTPKAGQGEIYAVYLLKQSQGRGIGYALFQKARQILRDGGMNAAYLWVLDTNVSALDAYKKWGGVIDADFARAGKIGGQDTREIMVAFRF